MSINLTQNQIEKIADSLDCGMRCYYNKKTKEIAEILNLDNSFGGDEEPWQEELDKIEANWEDYFEIEPMEGNDSFQVMADYVNFIENKDLKEKLVTSLNGPKPFRNFKWQIDGSGEYRQKWFDFKKEKYITWVTSQINSYDEFEN
jgi:hypothetical protein